MNWQGIIIGAAAFMIIGIFHPIVIKTEYYFGARIWPLFLIVGLVCIGATLFIHQTLIAAVLGIFGFSSLWSIQEILEQKERVKKGWFPKNPNKNQGSDDNEKQTF